jgi:S1-C subfamily serine protease
VIAVCGLTVALAAPAAASTATEAANVQQQQCSYEDVYQERIDSVVLVRTGGGLGSGFVYDGINDSESTYVVTNQHVVNETAEVLVRFNQGETARGTVVGTDALSDLAVIRVEQVPAYATPIPLEETSPSPGQSVAALGSPYGLQSTVTSGIVSGTNRSVPTRFGYALPNTIQTDAPINPGNSGGPLVSCPGGNVIGVNRAGGGEDIGFAIPASIVQRVVPSLIQTGAYDHAFLGVRGVEVTEPVAAANDLNSTSGILVVRTIQGMPAEDVFRESRESAVVSGARIPIGGDVIVEIGNRSIESPNDLAQYLALEASPGETVEVTVLRDGEEQTLNVTLAERPTPDDV